MAVSVSTLTGRNRTLFLFLAMVTAIIALYTLYLIVTRQTNVVIGILLLMADLVVLVLNIRALSGRR